MRRYEVLYGTSQTSKKPSASRKNAQMDGILTVHPPPSCLVTLERCLDEIESVEEQEETLETTLNNGETCFSSSSSEEEEDHDEENSKKKSWKKRRQEQQKKQRQKRQRQHLLQRKQQQQHTINTKNRLNKGKQHIVFSGVQRETSQRLFSACLSGEKDDVEEEGVVVMLSSRWECHIQRRLPLEDSKEKKLKVVGKRAALPLTSKSAKQSLLTSNHQRSIKPGIRTNSILRTTKTKPLFTSQTNCKALEKTPPRQGLSSSHSKKKLTQESILKQKSNVIEKETTSCSALMPSSKRNMTQPRGLVCSSTSNHPRRLVTSLHSRPSQCTTLSGTNSRINTSQPHQIKNNQIQTESAFPGAVGGPPVAPAKVKSILKPHQREGVAFLWNCLTGSSPGLQRLWKEHIQKREGCEEEEDCGLYEDSEEENEWSNPNSSIPRTKVKHCKNQDSSPRCQTKTHDRNTQNGYHGAILADEMGLGKTLMTITTIFALHRRTLTPDRFIVVCPSSLITNWSREFDKWLGKASQPKRVVVNVGGEVGMKRMKAFVPVKPQMSEVLILSYEMVRMHSTILSKAQSIDLLVVDEGHRLKNTSGSMTLSALQQISCRARLLLTGTPIQNDLTEFFNLVDFVNAGILGDLSSFRRLYERPITTASTKNATPSQKRSGQAQSCALEAITSTFMLRRLQRDVLKTMLPPRMEFLLFCRPSRLQCRLYERFTSSLLVNDHEVGDEIVGSSSWLSSSESSLTLLTKLRKLCSHPKLTKEEDLTTSSNMRSPEEDVSLSGKLKTLETLLATIRQCHPQDKCIVVSNFTSALTLIETTLLEPRKWPHVRLDGSMNQNDRQAIVDTFHRISAEQSFVFLLSSKAGGCGLNLVGANRLILFDADWNPATDMQAMGRIYRQGQSKPCFIYRLFTTGTVEEVIYQRQIQKGNVATLAVDHNNVSKGRGKNNNSGFTKEELRDCFTLKVHCDECDTKEKLGNQWLDFDGIQSLVTQGCPDEPLLTTIEELEDVVSYVHICNDGSIGNNENDGAYDEVSCHDDAVPKKEIVGKTVMMNSGDDSSSEEEEWCEFD